jgi:HEPN domain-containing protein
MKQPEQALRELVRQWLAKADLDYRTAERLLGDTEPIRESVAFHCQQAAEKYLKALLVSPKRRSGTTASLARKFAWLACRPPALFRFTRLREKRRHAIVQSEFHP